MKKAAKIQRLERELQRCKAKLSEERSRRKDAEKAVRKAIHAANTLAAYVVELKGRVKAE